jgi:subtilisin family serine protease
MNEQYKDGKEVSVSIDTFADGLVQASKAAIQDGVRVINMSLGNDVDSPIRTPSRAARMFEMQKQNVEKIRQLALAHPSILFVVAAGNDSKWIDEASRLAMPCGVQAPNILCVGALDKNGKIASFSNLLITEGAFVMTYGVEVLSTIPTKICMTPAYQVLGNDNYFTADLPIEAVAQRLREDCKTLSLLKLNGTSMASPIIARQAAIILEDHPELTGAQVIDALLAKTVETKVGKLSFAKLKIEKPSWYSADDNDWMNKSDKPKVNLPVLGSDYFEFLIPTQK